LPVAAGSDFQPLAILQTTYQFGDSVDRSNVTQTGITDRFVGMRVRSVTLESPDVVEIQ
jgi:hypothetical protein